MLPTPSILIEWETGPACRPQRPRRGLAELRRQIQDLGGSVAAPVETVICRDPDRASAESLAAALADTGGADTWPGVLRVVASAVPLPYYQKKNHAAARASHDLILFLDSDVVIEPGWLQAMVAPFRDWRVAALVGHTHLEAGSRFERAVALFWLFGPRRPYPGLGTAPSLVANNCAFRRALFRRFPFPVLATYREACAELSRQLVAAGVVIHQQVGARASHPPPRGGFFFRRAMEAGRDRCLLDAREGRSGFGRCLAHAWRDLRQVLRRVRARRRPLRADAADVLAGLLLGAAYGGVKAVGYLAARTRHARHGQEDAAPT
jgi:hypothetical protein